MLQRRDRPAGLAFGCLELVGKRGFCRLISCAEFPPKGHMVAVGDFLRPIFDPQTGHTHELVEIVRHQNEAF